MNITKSDIIIEYQTDSNDVPDDKKAYFGGVKGIDGVKAQMSSYIDGYREAINAIYNRFSTEAENGHIWVQDTIIFPLIYNHRHCVELELKRLFCLSDDKFRRLAQFHTHNLNDLWTEVKNFITIKASRINFNVDIEAIEHYVSTLDSYDEQSSRFRYPMDTSLNSTNPTLQLMNVCTFHNQMNLFHDAMDLIYHSLEVQVEEWHLDKDFRRQFPHCLRCNYEDLKVALDYQYPKFEIPNKAWLSMSEIPELSDEDNEREYRHCQSVSNDVKELILILFFSLEKQIYHKITISERDDRLIDLLKLCNDTFSNENIFSAENLNKAFWQYFYRIIMLRENIISLADEILALT